MPEQDEIVPNWPTERTTPQPGVYIWTLRVTEAKPRDTGTSKPFLLLRVQVADEQFLGFEFDFRLYYSPKAEKWCKYFLKKFGYPPELLDGADPVLKLSAIRGLSGKARVHVSHVKEGDADYVNFDCVGFERIGETDLEQKLEKERKEAEGQLPLQAAEKAEEAPAVPEIDLNEDIKREAPAEQGDLAAALDLMDNMYLDKIDEDMDIGIGG